METFHLKIVGGGAAGFFAAINTAELCKAKNRPVKVEIFEASGQILKKVRISGGGRCNVTHHQYEVRRFIENYPRGSKELLSAMQRFQARDTVEWFKKRGVRIVPEEDGRMFPDTDSSQTIIDCFLNEAQRLGVKISVNRSVKSIEKLVDGKFRLQFPEGEGVFADAVMIATGSSQMGYQLATGLGHKITELAPSLFSFKIEDKLLHEMSGTSFPAAETRLETPDGAKFAECGPLLITHWGLSGPAVLKISAWSAREMMHADYRAQLTVNWIGIGNLEKAISLVTQLKADHLKAQVKNGHPTPLTQRFWDKLLSKIKLDGEKRWADVSKAEIRNLAEALFATKFQVLGKNRYKDEFVECGGVDLKEINFKTMESKLCPGLYFAGEVLDIDGITGGFNFQNAWTGAWIIAESISSL